MLLLFPSLPSPLLLSLSFFGILNHSHHNFYLFFQKYHRLVFTVRRRMIRDRQAAEEAKNVENQVMLDPMPSVALPPTQQTIQQIANNVVQQTMPHVIV